MLETRAIVIRLEGAEAIVEARQGGSCGQCSQEKTCGKAAQLFSSAPRSFRVRNDMNARVGEEVQISMADGVLLRSAVVMYLLPLALLLAGGMLGSHWAGAAGHDDAYAATGALLGLAAGFALARLIARRQRVLSSAQPAIARCAEMHHF
jgi:sigma-E factor negative regulatory protein RseC